MTFEAICERLAELTLTAAEAKRIRLIARNIRGGALRSRRAAKTCQGSHPLTGPDAVVRYKTTTHNGRSYTYTVCLICERASRRIPRHLHKKRSREANACTCGHGRVYHTPECYHENSTGSGKFDCDCTAYKRRA